MGLCDGCSSTEDFREMLIEVFNENMIDEIQYKQWLSTDRSTLETVSKSADEFLDAFCEKLEALRRHDFIAKQQSAYCHERKESLAEGEVLVIGDFAENYSFVLQDAAQGFHWNNAQATLHPFVFYFRNNLELQHTSFVIISDCLTHDTAAVHLFQKHLVYFLCKFLCENLRDSLKLIIYFSDGTASQYKNCKNFINLSHHKTDFGVDAQWHFFATSHGKGPCDGVGGTVKRLAARASLQRPYNEQIMTPRQLYDFAVENISAVHFHYCSKEEREEESKELEMRFELAHTIQGTQKLHAFVPISQSTLEVKMFSKSADKKEVRVTAEEGDVPFEEIKGFVTVKYDNQWCLACILQTFPEVGEVKVSFLHPAGPSASFCYPRGRPDILDVPSEDVLTVADPTTTSGRTYRLTAIETQRASQALLRKM